MSRAHETHTVHTPSSAKRNAVALALAQAFSGSIGPIAVSVGALSGAYLLRGQDQSLATLPAATYAVGAAIFAMPVSILCHKFGRRIGFILGAILGILGAGLACFTLLNSQFWLFCFALLIIGGSSAFVQQYRFAAADQGSDTFKTKAISWVMMGGMLAAIIGPQTVLKTKDMFLPIPFAGTFIGLIAVLCIGIAILLFLKPVTKTSKEHATIQESTRPLTEIMKQPTFFIALLCAVSSYALMTFMMTGAPLAMIHHGHSEQNAIIGIQWHVMAMFAPSFFTGALIIRFGKIPIIATGLGLLILCASVAMSGLTLWNFWVSLILLGVGWNFGFIGATALLGESYTAPEKNKVQGTHDTILFSCTASAALLSGAVFNAFGWSGVASVLYPIAGLSLLTLMWLKRRQKARAPM